MNFGQLLVRRKRSWDVLNKASGNWPRLLRSIGGLQEDHLNGRHCPCPCCGGTDRFRWINDEGPAGWLCSQCGGKNQQGGGGTGIDLLMRLRGWTFREAIYQLECYYNDMPFQPAPQRKIPFSQQARTSRKHSELERFRLLEIAGQLEDNEYFLPAQARTRLYSKRWAVYAANNYDSACSAVLEFDAKYGIVDERELSYLVKALDS